MNKKSIKVAIDSPAGAALALVQGHNQN